MPPRNITINLVTNWGDAAPASAAPPPIRPPSSGGYRLGLNNRQCKTAVWLYSWLDEYLAGLSTDEADGLLYWLNLAIEGLAEGGLRRIAAEAFIAVLVAMVGSPGPTPDDPIVIAAAIAFAEGFAQILEDVGAVPQFSAAQVADAHAKLATRRGTLICTMARTSNVASLQGLALRELYYAGFDWQQRLLAGAILNPTMLGLLLATADWWPSFDEDYLSGITEGCC